MIVELEFQTSIPSFDYLVMFTHSNRTHLYSYNLYY